MKKWTNQQRLLNLCSIVGSGAALGIMTLVIKIGPQNTIEILSLADKLGPDEAIRILKMATMKVINLSDYKNAM